MSTPPEKNRAANAKECPWAAHPSTGQQERLAPPAPVIELDTPQHTGPVKPLGPRRLARLQREMAEHARDIQNSEPMAGGEVDEALLATQRRLADLAVRAAAANHEDREAAERSAAMAHEPGTAEAAPGGSSAAEQSPVGSGSVTKAPAQPESDAPDPADTDSSEPVPVTSAAVHTPAVAPEPVDGETEPEYITITFPQAVTAQARGVGLADSLADPASWPASTVRYGPVTETSRIPVVQGLTPEGTSGTKAGAAASASDTQTAEVPAKPVRAVDAEGLTLLEPGAYSRGASTTRILLALLVLVIAAFVAALIIFIL